jgi:hypothetical protein
MRGISSLAAKFTVSFSRRTLLHGVSKTRAYRTSLVVPREIVDKNSIFEHKRTSPSVTLKVNLKLTSDVKFIFIFTISIEYCQWQTWW